MVGKFVIASVIFTVSLRCEDVKFECKDGTQVKVLKDSKIYNLMEQSCEILDKKFDVIKKFIYLVSTLYFG